MTDACPTWPTLLAWLENDLPDEESQLCEIKQAVAVLSWQGRR